MAKWNANALDIQTRSVEKVLVPLVAQVGVLVGIQRSVDNNVLADVLANLELSVCKFTSIGHEMGNVNADIRDEMSEACDVTNKACTTIVAVLNNNSNAKFDQELLTEASRSLLSAITRILILADKTAISKMVSTADKVDSRLSELENVSNFTEFVTAFSQFGSDMVELAYISGERQNDLKDDLQRAEVCASRAILEKSTMMLLTTCKTCLRHPDSPLALGNRNSVFKSMRSAMKVLKAIIQDNEYPDSNISRGILLDFKEFEESIENALSGECNFAMIDSICERLDNIAIDMDDVINVEQINASIKAKLKTRILNTKDLHKKLRRHHLARDKVIGDEKELHQLLRNVSETTNDMIQELIKASADQVSITLSESSYKETLRQLKGASLSGQLQIVEENADKLEKLLQNILEVSKLVKNSSSSEACIITASRIEENLSNLLPQLIDAGKMLSGHPSSKITQENLEVFIDVWDTQVDELSALLRNIIEAGATNESAEWLSIYIPMASKLSS